MPLPSSSDIQTSFIYLKCLCHLLATFCVCENVTVTWKAAPSVSQCISVDYLHDFSASTTDRHCKCTDDVVTEICKISVGDASNVFYHLWSSSGMTFHISLLSVSSVCFNVVVRFFCVRLPHKRGKHATVKYPVCVCFMLCHLIDVNWRQRQCSQSKAGRCLVTWPFL